MRRRGGFGTTGKPGRKLRLEDLQEQFGVSLQVSPPPTRAFVFSALGFRFRTAKNLNPGRKLRLEDLQGQFGVSLQVSLPPLQGCRM